MRSVKPYEYYDTCNCVNVNSSLYMTDYTNKVISVC